MANENAVSLVCKLDEAVYLRADEVALDLVLIGGTGLGTGDVDPATPVARDNVARCLPGSRRVSSDGVL